MPASTLRREGDLVGRAAELRRLERLLSEAARGEQAAVAVSGEPGIGKSRLLRELAERARAAGFEVLVGRGSEMERHVPFDLVVDALDLRLSSLEPSVLRRLGDERLSELASVLPSLAGTAGRPVGQLDVERYRAHHAVRAALELLAERRPLLLALDDLHWADPASIELVAHLLRRGVGRSLLALAFRPHPAPEGLANALERATREGSVESLTLGPLSSTEAADLLGAGVDAASLEGIRRESGGIPFYLEQLARAGEVPLLPDSTPAPTPGAEVPAAVRAAIEQELYGLSAESLLLAQGAAVVGEPFDPELAAEVAGLDRFAAAAALDELVAADVLRDGDTPGRLTFRHPIVRRAVHDAAPLGWRIGAHGRAARALGERGSAIGLLAHHVQHSAKAGDERAIALLTEAGDAAAARAPAAAARWYGAALRLLPESADRERRLSLLVPLAGALATAGRLHSSRRVLGEALELVPTDDPATRGPIVAMVARAEQGLGHAHEARNLLEVALREAGPGGPQAPALMLELAKNNLMMCDWDAAAARAHEALALAEDLGDGGLSIKALAVSAYLAATRPGDDPYPKIAAATAAIDALADAEVTPTILEGLGNLTYAELNVERWEAADRHAERGLRLCRAGGQGHLFTDFMLVLAVSRMMVGRLADARRAIEAGVEASILLDNAQAVAQTEGLRAWVASLQGDNEVALAAGAAAKEAVERAPNSLYAWMASLCYGEALIEAGQHEQGRAEMLAVGGPELTTAPPTSRPHWQRALVEVEIAAGRIDAADEMARRLDPAGFGLTMRTGDARYARAAVLLARGDRRHAATVAGEAFESYEESGTRIHAARAALLGGRALALDGDTDAAAERFEWAYLTFAACGARRYADRAAKELRGTGRRVPRTRGRAGGAAAGPGVLSAREREVAELVAQGHTNRQIAEELYLSRKTVDSHLANAFGKLGVSSRAALAAAVERWRADGA